MEEKENKTIKQHDEHLVINTTVIEKESKYLKIWKKRILTLTNNALLSYEINEGGENNEHECTMHLYLTMIESVKLNEKEENMIVS